MPASRTRRIPSCQASARKCSMPKPVLRCGKASSISWSVSCTVEGRMIRHINPSEIAKDQFVVTDIENDTRNGNVLDVDTAWRFAGEIQHVRFSDWESWWQWLVKASDQDKRFRTLWAHNGG